MLALTLQFPKKYPWKSRKIAVPETRFIGLHFCRWSYGSIFIQIFAVGFKKCVTATECVLAVQDHPRSMIWYQLKVRMWLPISPSLYYGRILHRFWDTAICSLKIAYVSYPSLIWRPRSLCSLWNFMGYPQWRLHDHSWSRFDMILDCVGQTEGRRIYHS